VIFTTSGTSAEESDKIVRIGNSVQSVVALVRATLPTTGPARAYTDDDDDSVDETGTFVWDPDHLVVVALYLGPTDLRL
jgi:hypothetical protein